MPGTNLTRAEAAARADLVSVQDYAVELDLCSGPTTFPTTTTVRFACRAPGASTWLDFVGDSVQSVVLNGRALDPAAVWADGRIELAGLAADNEVRIEATGIYARSGEGLHRFVDPVDDAVYLYTQFEPALSRQMFAVFEQPDLKARFRFTVTAPEDWKVLSNQPTPPPEPAGAGRAVWRFEPTPPMSSYITAVCAGPYAEWRDSMAGRSAHLPLGLYCRASLAEHLDADFLFELTKTGISFFEKEFDCDFPFAKFDQVFAPEYIWGGMENAGCVTINESYVFRGQPPAPLAERRALTILHEIAHMWFGDLVTMRWWDDLWLNESFAEWASSVCQAEATSWTDAWTTFHAHEKTWAYQEDQRPDTHPVVADLYDLHIAETGTDAITYAKGGSALKQLVAFAGREAFVAGLRSYFREHAWGNTTAADLLAHLERASGRDLTDWSTRWLNTSGPDLLALEVTTDADGVVTSAAMRQSAPAGQPVRPHRLGIGSYVLRDGRLVRTAYDEVDVDGERTELPALVGRPRPDLLLPNDEDLTYARIRLDAHSLATVLAHPRALESLPRSLVVGALWELMRDGLFAPADFAAFVLECIPVERHPVVLRTMLSTTKQTVSMLLATLRWFLPPQQRAHWRARAVVVVRDALAAAEPGSDIQQQLASAYAALAQDPADVARVLGWLDGAEILPGFDLYSDLRWVLLSRVCSSGSVDAARIDAELRRDPSAAGQDAALLCRAALPTRADKEAAWELAVGPGELSSLQMEALGKGLTTVEDPGLLEPFVERYFGQIEAVAARHSFGLAEKYVKHFYPLELAGPVLRERTQRWLDEHPHAHVGMRRLVAENLALVEFAVVAQGAQQHADAAG